MASDDFNRANESPLATPWSGWGSLANINLASNRIKAAASGNDSGCKHSSTVAVAEFSVGLVGDGDGGPGLASQAGGSNGYLESNFDLANYYAFRLDAGAFNQLGANTPGAYTLGKILKFRRSGNDLIFTVDGVDLMTRTDTTYLSLQPAAFIFGTLELDNFSDGVAGDSLFAQVLT